MMGTVSAVSKFFEHGKRQDKLVEGVESTLPDSKKKRVKPLCRTRWVERFSALEVFIDLYPAIVSSLQDIACGEDSVSWNWETVADASSLLAAIEKFSFILSLVTVYNILSYIRGVTVMLQQRSLDVIQGISLIQDVQMQLKDVRKGIDDWHKSWYEFALKVAEDVGVEPSIPRRCSRQTQRDNVEGESPEVYYRRSLTIPFLEHLENELDNRFSHNAKIASSGLCLVPSVIMKSDNWTQKVSDLATLYEADLPAPLSLQVELDCWKHKFLHYTPDDLPTSPLVALNQCDCRLFPNLSTLLRLICTIPITSCEAERTFSALRRMKTFLRTTMKEDRLNGLALMHVHRQIPIDFDEAMEKFARKHPRKLQLL